MIKQHADNNQGQSIGHMPTRILMRATRHLTTFAGACTILMAATASHAAQEFHVSNEFSQTYNNIAGPGKSQSSLTEGMRFLDVLNVNGSGNITDQWKYNFNLGFKGTDDIRNDAKVFSMTNMNLRLSDKVHTINLGDTFESFSQYSLNTSVKGASYKYKQDKAFIQEATVMTGLAYPRWDDAFGMGFGTSLAPEKMIYGGRIKKEVLDNFQLAANVVGGRDLKRIYSTDQAYENAMVYSADFEYKPLRGLTIAGEGAYAHERETASANATPTGKFGNAWRFSVVGDQDPSRVALEYERVSTDFVTLVGSATADRERAKGSWRYKASKNITTNLGFLWFRDNLDGSKAVGTTHYYKPETGITFKNIFGRKYASLGLTYKIDYAERNDATVKADNIINANYKDRFGFVDSDVNFGYIAYNSHLGTAARSNEFTYNLTLSSRHTIKSVILSPSMYFGFWRSKDEVATTTDQIYEASGGLNVDIPHLNINTTARGGMNQLTKSVGAHTAKVFANASINWRPSFLQKLRYSEQTMLYVRYAMNDFRFTQTAENRDYRENSMTTGVNFNF